MSANLTTHMQTPRLWAAACSLHFSECQAFRAIRGLWVLSRQACLQWHRHPGALILSATSQASLRRVILYNWLALSSSLNALLQILHPALLPHNLSSELDCSKIWKLNLTSPSSCQRDTRLNHANHTFEPSRSTLCPVMHERPRHVVMALSCLCLRTVRLPA